MSDKQHRANRRNALQSTGPRTPEGAAASKMNALGHGLRAVQTVVPGENPDEWEAHRAAIVDDLAPLGAMELALAEHVAVKLWRLGRVVRFEADVIANAQSEDELLQAHEMSHERGLGSSSPKRTDIPTLQDMANARYAAETAAKKLTERAEALVQLQGLTAMVDDDAFPDWTFYTVLLEDFHPDKDVVECLFNGENVSPFLARDARKMILICFGDKGELDSLQVGLATVWAQKLEQLKQDVHDRRSEHNSLADRYEEALERRRLASGLPETNDLDRIQKYEAHLERGLHRDLDRLRDLQAARGAVPPRGPSVAVAVVQSGTEVAARSKMASFGKIDIGAAEMTEEPAGLDSEG
jgi:hypothetical protein